MSKLKASSLGAGLIVKKGQAVPAATSVEGSAELPTPPVAAAPAPAPVVSVEPAPSLRPASVEVIPAAAPADGGKKKDSRIPMTVKLDFELYERLKTHGTRLLGQGVRKSSQEIFVEALEEYLAKHTDKLG